jgi:hypothetical protein
MKLIAQIHPRIPVIVLERHHAGRILPLVPKYLSWRRSKSFVVGEFVAFPLGKVNLSESVPTAAPIPQFGMNQVRKQFDTIYDARAGPGEVSVGVHGEDAVS